MFFRLILKCFEKLLDRAEEETEIKVFEILTEIYKFFKSHPPEALEVTKNVQIYCRFSFSFMLFFCVCSRRKKGIPSRIERS